MSAFLAAHLPQLPYLLPLIAVIGVPGVWPAYDTEPSSVDQAADDALELGSGHRDHELPGGLL